MSAATEKAGAVERGDRPEQPRLDRRRFGRRLLLVVVAIAVVVAVITLVPGLAGLRHRFAHARWEWLVVGVGLKALSGLCYVAVFRSVFCPRMSWRLSNEIGLSELGANAVVPTGGAGGLALGAWALRRRGMDSGHIARRSVAFFLLTSIPNVVGVIILGLGLAVGIFEGSSNLALTLVPAIVAAGAIALTIAGGRWAGRAAERLVRRGTRARTRAVLKTLAGGVEESLDLLRHRDPWLLAGLVGYLGFDVMVLWATFHAFGGSPALAILWLGYLLGELGGLIPVPGGIGGVEVGVVGLLVVYGIHVELATAAVLAYRAIALWVPAVVGGGAFLLLRRSLARETAALDSCGPGGEVDIIGRGRVTLGA